MRRLLHSSWLALLASVAAVATPAVDAQPAAPSVPRAVADYVHGLVDGLSNVVAQEDFRFAKPKQRTVRSELLLVRYPGSDRHLLVFRDVSHLNDAPLPGREARLNELFLRSFDNPDARAHDIATDGHAHVPPVLNPLFAVAFLQAPYQARFEIKDKDAGRGWADQVRELSFVEKVRPTLLRGGADGRANVPTKGRAWVEMPTGRILQTELEVRDKTITTLVTKFGLDARLQMMVPLELRATDAGGAATSTATYTNFRRFDVKTDELLRMPARSGR
jgi:hypothetical protein